MFDEDLRSYLTDEDRQEIYAQAKAEGIAEGEAKGKAEGRAEGIAEGEARGAAAERQRITDALRSAGVAEDFIAQL